MLFLSWTQRELSAPAFQRGSAFPVSRSLRQGIRKETPSSVAQRFGKASHTQSSEVVRNGLWCDSQLVGNRVRRRCAILAPGKGLIDPFLGRYAGHARESRVA
jgi:hypothetical protein